MYKEMRRECDISGQEDRCERSGWRDVMTAVREYVVGCFSVRFRLAVLRRLWRRGSYVLKDAISSDSDLLIRY